MNFTMLFRIALFFHLLFAVLIGVSWLAIQESRGAWYGWAMLVISVHCSIDTLMTMHEIKEYDRV